MAKEALPLTRIVDVVETAVAATTNFESRKVAHLYQWWTSANSGSMPLRRMFDVVDHRPIVANLFLAEVRPDGDFQFKLMGEIVNQIVGRNRTGELVQRGALDEYGHDLHAYYQAIVDGRTCRLCTGRLIFAIGGARRLEAIDCPLADDAGERVAAIIGVMDAIM